MTALLTILDSVTDPAFLVIVGPMTLVAGTFVFIEARADRIRRVREQLRDECLAWHLEQRARGDRHD